MDVQVWEYAGEDLNSRFFPVITSYCSDIPGGRYYMRKTRYSFRKTMCKGHGDDE